MKVAKHKKWRKGFPYYKVQYWDSRVQAWHDIQRRFETKQAATRYSEGLKRKTRLMIIYRDRREVVK